MLRRLGYDLTVQKQNKQPRIALFLGHLGLGDQIWLSGAVRYLARMYDYLHVVCKLSNRDTLTTLYSDLPAVQLVTVKHGYNIFPTIVSKGYCFPIQPGKYAQIYECGFYKKPTSLVNMEDLPGEFYDDLGLNRSIRTTHFSLPPLPNSRQLYEPLIGMKYIFVQTRSSEDITPIVSWDINRILTIDPNINQYSPDHSWYELAERFVGKPFLDYCDTIKHASELHLVNSSFYTLASQISPLDAKVKLCYDRHSVKVIPHYNFT